VVLPNHLPQTIFNSWSLNAPRTTTALSSGLAQLLADRRALSAWLSWLASDSIQRAHITRASYWHTNGFAKLVLHNATHFRIRLHVWPAGDKRLGESDPHSHRWSFASAVLTGDGIAISEQREAATGIPHTRYLYDGRKLATDRCVQLCDVGSFIVAKDDHYATQTTTIHTVGPVGRDLVATLVLQGPHTSSSTHVYRPLGTPAPNEATKPMEDHEVQHLITEVNAHLLAQEPAR
jgi:hypothetical protein